MKTKACRTKLMADLKSATTNCIESVRKTHATKIEKNVPLCNKGLQLCSLLHLLNTATR